MFVIFFKTLRYFNGIFKSTFPYIIFILNLTAFADSKNNQKLTGLSGFNEVIQETLKQLSKPEEEDLEEVHRVGQPNYKGDGVHDVLNRASDVNDGLNESFDLDSLLKEINDLEE